MTTIREIDASELNRRLQTQVPPLVLDVREHWELSLASLPGAVVHIPMAEVPRRITELERGRETVVMCHHGARSRQVVAFLQQCGFEHVLNLAGGIDAWTREVDPGVPAY